MVGQTGRNARVCPGNYAVAHRHSAAWTHQTVSTCTLSTVARFARLARR